MKLPVLVFSQVFPASLRERKDDTDWNLVTNLIIFFSQGFYYLFAFLCVYFASTGLCRLRLTVSNATKSISWNHLLALLKLYNLWGLHTQLELYSNLVKSHTFEVLHIDKLKCSELYVWNELERLACFYYKWIP